MKGGAPRRPTAYAAPVLAALLFAGLPSSACGTRDDAPDAARTATAAPDDVAASDDDIAVELGVDVGPDVPPDALEELHLILRNSRRELRSVRRVGPDLYRVRSWGSIPHMASESLFRRVGTTWELVRHGSWVLFGDA